MELGDLEGLAIGTPYAHSLLLKFQTGLSQPVGEILAENCAHIGECSLGADLACGTLAVIESQRASTEQLESLHPLALQLAALPDGSWSREAGLPSKHRSVSRPYSTGSRGLFPKIKPSIGKTPTRVGELPARTPENKPP